MDQELNPEKHQLWLSAIQILVHSEQLFVVFQIKKIQWKLEDHPFRRSPSCHTLSKALDISEKTPLTPNEGLASKEAYKSWVIERSWRMQESPTRHEAWLIWIKQLIYREMLKNCIKNDFLKQFTTNR